LVVTDFKVGDGVASIADAVVDELVATRFACEDIGTEATR
jgi:hypothetical protein